MEHVAAAVFVAFLWWGSTGVIFYLDRLPRPSHRWSLVGATLLGLCGIWGLAASAGEMTLGGVYAAFVSAIAVWAWHEMSFLSGLVAGPRRHACPPDCRGWSHFRHAVEAILFHELAIAATAAIILAVTWGGANAFGLWTFLALWAMRLSAKLNLHLGVPNTAAELLPDHLAYMGTFFSRGPVNALFPLSITLGTAAAVWLTGAAMTEPGEAAAIGFGMLASLVALGVFEHWSLVLSAPAGRFWRWALGPDGEKGADRGAEASGCACNGVARRDDREVPRRAEPCAPNGENGPRQRVPVS